MGIKVRLRRITGDNNYSDPADLGEAFLDALNARIGFDFGGVRPRWYPRLDAQNNLIMNPNTKLMGVDAAGDDGELDTYIGFGVGQKINLFSDGVRVATVEPGIFRVNQDLIITQHTAIKTLNVGDAANFASSVTFQGSVTFAGGTNLELGDAVLPGGSEEGDLLEAGSGNVRRWASKEEIMFGTVFAGMNLAIAQEPGFNIDVRSERYAVLRDEQEPIGYISPSLHKLANGLSGVGITSSFSRATPATRMDRKKDVRTVAINQARVNYSLTTGEKSGVRIEGESSNLVANKGMFGAELGNGASGVLPSGWATENIDAANIDVVAKGTYKGVPYVDLRFHGNNSSGNEITINVFPSLREFAAVTGEIWSGSMYYMPIDLTAPPTGLYLALGSYNSSGGSVVGAANLMSLISVLGWSRRTVTHTVKSGADRLGISTQFTVSAGSAYDFTVRLGVAQIERLPASTSLILNGDNVRAADFLTLPATELYMSPFEGTTILWFRPAIVNVNHPFLNPTVWYASDDPTLATNNNSLSLMWDRTANTLRAVVRSSGVTVADMALGTVTQGAVHKAAFAWKSSDFAAKLDQNAMATDTTGTAPITLTAQSIGSNGITNHPFMDLLLFRTFRRRLTEAEMNQWTT